MGENDVQGDASTLILKASGGRALRGLAFIQAENEVAAAGKQLLLSPITDVAVMGSSQARVDIVYCFSGSKESASFYKAVMDKGWSTAMHMQAQSFLWGVGAGASFDMKKVEHKLSEEKLSRKVSEACITQCMYVPTRSFQIPRNKMVLSDAAVERALAIQDVVDADNFLTAFNPFVSESLYHVGGVFFNEVTVKCKHETSLVALMYQTQKEIKWNAMVELPLSRIFSVKGEASGNRWDCTDSSSQETSAVKVGAREEKIIIIGPSDAPNGTEFLQKLKDDWHCWAIIDKTEDGKDSLVGAWVLLLRHSQALASCGDARAVKLKSSAKILCERWLYVAEKRKTCIRLPSKATLYDSLISECHLFIANLAADPMDLELQDEPLSLLLDLPQEASLRHFLQSLDMVLLDAGEPLKMSQVATDHARYFIRNHKKPPESSAQKALSVLWCYGFDDDGNLLSSHLERDQLTSMMQELKAIQNAPRSRTESIVPRSAWGPDLKMQGMPASSLPPGSCQFCYVGDVVVDRNFYAIPPALKTTLQTPARRLIDCLRHRVNPLKHLLQGTSDHLSRGHKDMWDSDEDEDEDLQASTAQHKAVSPFELLILIIKGSDLPLKIAICDLLLSQRSAAPLILSPSLGQIKALHQGTTDDMQLAHYIQALSYVQVSLEKQQKTCIAEDTHLPRVVFISNKSVEASHAAIVASRVLNCDFMSQHCRKDMSGLAMTTVMEVGVGFISVPPSTQAPPSTQGEAEYLACIAIQITGPYNRVTDFIADFADVVVLELGQGQQEWQYPQNTVSARNPCVLRWEETNVEEGLHKRKKLIWGQESYLVKGIGVFVHSEFRKLNEPKVRKSMLQMCTRHFPPGHEPISFERPQRMLDECDFSNIRNSLTLQRSLVVEAKAYFECLQLKHNPARKHEKESLCVQEREKRLCLAKHVTNIPIMRLFYHLLMQSDFASRRVGIMWLEQALSEKMCPILADASKKVDDLFKASSKNRNDLEAKRQYIKAKQEYVEKSIGLDNLWRELCHIFEADPMSQRHLARIAARHLLDGFPLEILDGDAGMLCKNWVESVLTELDSMTKAESNGRQARILVVSVMGLQSSGKSTMLNLMFGTQLRTSAGRCTRGVYIQLVPSERAEYDYVLLLDTEGLRSPEYFGLEASEVRDNRLATFGLLPADASVFMVSNEDDSGLKEVLPMVLLAFKGSAIAKRCGQRIKTKVIFVYRSVDTNDTNKLRGNRQKLHEHLRDAAEEVSQMGGGQLSSATAASEMLDIVFSDFRVDDDEKVSDVKCLGNLKKGGMPPTDTPEWAYGERVVEIREYLHLRLLADDIGGFKASSFPDWAERLTLVWDCICSADFELSFKSKIEFNAYLELQAALQPLRTAVHKEYMQVFSSLERKMMDHMIKEEESSTSLFSVLEADVAAVVKKQTDKIDSILNTRTSYAKWRAQELDNWTRFCAVTKDWYRKRIADMESGVLRFEKVMAAYQRQCKSIIVGKFESGEWGSKQSGEWGGQQSRDVWREKFERVFKRILEDAESKHPPISNDVHRKVMERYYASDVARVFDMHANVDKPARRTHESSSLVGWFKHTVLGQGGKLQDEPVYSELQLVIDRQLRDARQYSDIIVDNVISMTKHSLDTANPPLSRKEKGEAHVWVKNTLTNRMKEIQNVWDKEHNVVEKLRSLKTRDSLYDFFAGLANGLEAAAMLVRELQRCLEDELEEAHSSAVVRYVGSKLGVQNLVRDWRLMRAVLDYHLLSLQKAGSTEKLLRCVSDGGSHFTMMMEAVVGQAMDLELVQREWDELLQKVQRCLKGQASLKNPSVSQFVAALGRRLAEAVDGKLASRVRSSIHVEMYENRALDSDFYEKKLPELYQSLQRKANIPDLEKRRGAFVKAVMEDMKGLPDENCRPRCEATCPMCGSSCFHALGHVEAKHDCVHQPAGLSGTGWHATNALVEKTCLQMLETKCSIVLDDGTEIPFSDFDKHYPSWAQPSSNESLAMQVRESIFFNFQEELVQFFGKGTKKIKRCPPDTMPPTYNHHPERLRASLCNKLRLKFGDEHAWNAFSRFLESL